jgi:hypothetical protein
MGILEGRGPGRGWIAHLPIRGKDPITEEGHEVISPRMTQTEVIELGREHRLNVLRICCEEIWFAKEVLLPGWLLLASVLEEGVNIRRHDILFVCVHDFLGHIDAEWPFVRTLEGGFAT